GLRIAYLTDQNHVRSLAERILQRVLEGQGIESDFALRDDRFFMLMNELDRIFHGNDMALVDGIAMVDHGCQRRRLPRAGRSHYQYEAAFGHRDIFDDRGKLQLLNGLNVRFDVTEDQSHITLLPEDVDAEPTEFLLVERQIHLHLFFEFTPLLTAHQG